MREPEFYAGATLGFRQWRLGLGSGEHEPPCLQSMVRHGLDRPRYRWSLQGFNHARCPRLRHPNFQPGSFPASHGEVPARGCSCGFCAHGRRDASGSETSVHVAGGVVAGWGNVELHELGFRCGVAKILVLFEPDPRKGHADHDGVAPKKWAALERMRAESAIPLLPSDALRDDEEVRRYAHEQDLLLLEDQPGFRGFLLADAGGSWEVGESSGPVTQA